MNAASLDVQIDETPHLTRVLLKGGLTLGPRLRQFGKQLEASIMGCPARPMLLDFSQVEEVDSSGLGELVILYTTASQHDCRVCLIGASQRVKRLLVVTKLSRMLRCFEDEPRAIRWLQE